MELLCLDIINSNRFGKYLAKPRDMLNNEEWLRGILDKWDLEATFPVPPHDMKVLQELRGNISILIPISKCSQRNWRI